VRDRHWISFAANKIPKIRAAVTDEVNTARLAREHHDANVLALGGRIVNGKQAIEMVQTFLSTAFLGEPARQKISLLEMEEREKSELSMTITAANRFIGN
jgi:ribose 5-phosphate isomerase B